MLSSLFRRFCLGLLLCTSFAASAQTSPASTYAAKPGFALGRADTARAIHQLFRSRRGGGIAWLAVGTAGILASTLPAQQTTSAGVWTPGVVVGSAFALIGLNKRLQFGPGRERRVLRTLAATGQLPAGIKRRLKGKFAPVPGSDQDYNPLLAKGIYPTAPALAPSAAELQATAHNDTLRAIAHLFERRRKVGQGWAYAGVSGILAMVRVLTSPQTNGNEVNAGGVALLAGAFIVIPAAASIGNLKAYSEQHEEEVDRLYRSGQPLPKKIRNRFKKKDFE